MAGGDPTRGAATPAGPRTGPSGTSRTTARRAANGHGESAADELNSIPATTIATDAANVATGSERQPAREHHLTADGRVVLEVGQEVVEVRDGAVSAGRRRGGCRRGRRRSALGRG